MVRYIAKIDPKYEDKHTNDRRYFQDPYNENKVWEVTKLKGGYYLRQYLRKWFGYAKQGRGSKVTKRWLDQLGIFNFEEIYKDKMFCEAVHKWDMFSEMNKKELIKKLNKMKKQYAQGYFQASSSDAEYLDYYSDEYCRVARDVINNIIEMIKEG